jgi:heavy metal sensor kinase
VGSVSARLAVRFALLWAVLFGIFSASLYLWSRENLRRDAERELEVRGRMLADRLAEEFQKSPGALRPDFRLDLAQFLEASGLWSEVRKADGTILFASAAPPGDLERTDRIGDVSLRSAMSGQAYRGRLDQLLLFFGVAGVLSTALVALLGSLIARHALGPVEEVRRKAEQISRENVSERIPEPAVGGGPRELVLTFNEMLDRLERAMQDLESFAADAAHELRTPLATLRAEIETAVQQTRTPEEYQRVLGSVHEEVSRMSRIVTDLFTLAKLDMRQYALQKERVRLAPLLEEARETWAPMAAERRIEIRREGGDAEVLGDAAALRRVFMNLVENAVKYNRDGGEVTLSVSRVNGKALVRVKDTGVGISADHLPHLFRRFYRGDKARSREGGGAGLGLAICKSFVASHEGRIDVASSVGKGTQFTVELPAG